VLRRLISPFRRREEDVGAAVECAWLGTGCDLVLDEVRPALRIRFELSDDLLVS